MGLPSRGIVNGQRVKLKTLQDSADKQILLAFASAHMAMSPQVDAFSQAYAKELNRARKAVPAGESDSGEEEDGDPNATVPLTWLFTSGELKKLTEVIQSALDVAAKEAAKAAKEGADEATTTGVGVAATLTKLAQPAATQAGQQASATQVSVPQGTPAELLAQAQALDPENTDTVGVDETIDGIPNQAVKDVRNAAVTGIVAGLASQAMQQAVMMGVQEALTSALTASRNGIQDVFNQAVNLTLTKNADILNGWVWVCAGGSCIACLEMDGSTHTWDEDLNSHLSCQCMQVPLTGPLPDDFQTGDQWFNAQSDAVQQEILGPSKYLAWKSGDVQLMDFVDHEGGYVSEKSLKSLGLDYRDYLQTLPTAAEKREAQAALDEAIREMNAVEEVPESTIEEEVMAMAKAPELRLPTIPSEIDAQIADLQAQRDVLSAQKDAIQAKLGTLSEKWGNLVLKEADLDPEDDEEDIAKMETQIASVEKQQATQMAKMDKLDQQIAGIDSKISEVKITPQEKLAAIRQNLKDMQVQRELLYQQQTNLVEERDKLEKVLASAQSDPNHLMFIEHAVKMDLYHQTLDASDPGVKAYFKALQADKDARVASAAALNQQRDAEKLMDTLALQGKENTPEFAQAKADFEAGGAAYAKASKAVSKAHDDLWQKSPGVYKPELDSIAGFDRKTSVRSFGTDANGRFHETYTSIFKPEDIANHPRMLAVKAADARVPTRIAEIKSQLADLNTPIKNINKQVNAALSDLRDANAALGRDVGMMDATRPFSDVIDLPKGHQPPNELMQKMDYKMREPRGVTKSRIIDDINTRLKDNPAWQEYVSRAPRPNLGETYHAYIGEYATAADTKSAQLVADWIKKWGVAYRPGSPQWVAMQMAAKDEFGLDAVIHMEATKIAAGERFYAENGAAVRALMRAMYDNTQQWFADNGITEIDVYRGLGWQEGSPLVPKGINWGPIDSPNLGVGDMELNPFQSFSADINVSQGTTQGIAGAGLGGGGFAGGGFGGGSDYNFLIGAKVPVDRVLATAQTGFGAKLESEIVVMGRATDTIAYRAGTTVEAEFIKPATETAVSDTEMLYTTADGGTVRVTANADGTFTITNESVPQIKGGSKSVPAFGGGHTYATVQGSMKVGASKTYKTAAAINNALQRMKITNTYIAPAADATVEAGQIEKFVQHIVLDLPPLNEEAESDIVQVAKDALSGDGIASHTDAIALGSKVDSYLDDRIGPLADYGNQVGKILANPKDLTGDDMAWLSGDKATIAAHGGLTPEQALYQYSQAMREETVNLLQQVRDLDDVDLSLKVQDQEVADVLQDLQDVLPADWLQAINEDGDLTAASFPKGHQGTGFYSPQTGKVALDYNPNDPFVDQDLYTKGVHELGHVVEQRVDGVWQMERDFYDARTEGDVAQKLQNGIAKMTKKDSFADPYEGTLPTTYGTGAQQYKAYELLSHGLQWTLGKEAYAQARLAQDEEFQHFILGILFGAKN